MAVGEEKLDGGMPKVSIPPAEPDRSMEAIVWPLRKADPRDRQAVGISWATVLLGPVDDDGTRPVIEGHLDPGESVLMMQVGK